MNNWLVADGLGNLITTIAAILFVVIPIIAQLLAKLREAEQQRRPAQAHRRPMPERVDQEIEEFLRRAGKQREGPPARGAGAAEELRRRVGPPPPPSRTPELPVPAVVVEEGPSGESVQQHVQRHLDTKEFTERSAQLGSEVAQADENIDARLQQVFGHSVGRLARGPGGAVNRLAPDTLPPAEGVTTPALTVEGSSLIAMLADPQSIRQAIIISEILRRPEERWG